jgi:hypothetical protein
MAKATMWLTHPLLNFSWKFVQYSITFYIVDLKTLWNHFGATFINWGFSNGAKSVVWATLVWEISIPMTNKTNKLHYLEIGYFWLYFYLRGIGMWFQLSHKGKGKWGFSYPYFTLASIVKPNVHLCYYLKLNIWNLQW